jgi:transglutaminase-like putative cysteine protease
VTLAPHWTPWRFALDLPARAPIADSDVTAAEPPTPVGIVTDDQRLVAPAPITQPVRYRMTSIPGDAYPENVGSMRDAERAENLQLPALPREANPRTAALAGNLRAQHPDDAGYVRAVLQWFQHQIVLLHAGPPLLPATDSVDAFLFDSRRGFCEHYAGSFVVLLRAAASRRAW